MAKQRGTQIGLDAGNFGGFIDTFDKFAASVEGVQKSLGGLQSASDKVNVDKLGQAAALVDTMAKSISAMKGGNMDGISSLGEALGKISKIDVSKVGTKIQAISDVIDKLKLPEAGNLEKLVETANKLDPVLEKIKTLMSTFEEFGRLYTTFTVNIKTMQSPRSGSVFAQFRAIVEEMTSTFKGIKMEGASAFARTFKTISDTVAGLAKGTAGIKESDIKGVLKAADNIFQVVKYVNNELRLLDFSGQKERVSDLFRIIDIFQVMRSVKTQAEQTLPKNMGTNLKKQVRSVLKTIVDVNQIIADTVERSGGNITANIEIVVRDLQRIFGGETGGLNKALILMKRFIEFFKSIGSLNVRSLSTEKVAAVQTVMKQAINMIFSKDGILQIFSQKKLFGLIRTDPLEGLGQISPIKVDRLNQFLESVASLITLSKEIATVKVGEVDKMQVRAVLLQVGEIAEFFIGKGAKTIFGKIREVGKVSIMSKVGSFDPNTFASFALFMRAISSLIAAIARVRIATLDREKLQNLVGGFQDLIEVLTNKKKGGFMGGIFNKSLLKQIAGLGDMKIQGVAAFFVSVARTVAALNKIQPGNVDPMAYRDLGLGIQFLANTYIDVAKKIKKIDIDALNKFSLAVTRGIKTIAGPTLMKSITDPFKSLDKTFDSAGRSNARAYIKGFKVPWKISSPSRTAMELGRFIVQGFTLGLVKLPIEGAKWAAKTVASMTKAFGKTLTMITIFKALRNALMQPPNFSRWSQGIGGVDLSLRGLQMRLTMMMRQASQTIIAFEDAFANVSKTVDGTEEQLESLQLQLRQMASDPESLLSALDNAFVTLAQIGAAGGQLGVPIEELALFTETVGLLTQATEGIDVQGLSFFLARVASITGESDFGAVASSLVDLGNNFAATEGQIVELAERIIGTGAAAGLTSSEILGFATAIRASGMEAEAGASQFNMLIGRINKAVGDGGAKLEEMARVAGMTASEFQKSWGEDVTETIIKVVEGLGDFNSMELTQFFEEAGLEGIRMEMLLTLISKNTGVVRDAVKTAREGYVGLGKDAKNYNALQKEVEKRNQTIGASFRRLANNTKELSFTLGQVLRPLIVAQTNSLTAMVRRITDFIKANAENINLFMTVVGEEVTKTIESITNLAMAGVDLFSHFFLKVEEGKGALGGITGVIQGVLAGFDWLRDRIDEITEKFKRLIDPFGIQERQDAAAEYNRLLERRNELLGETPSEANITELNAIDLALRNQPLFNQAGKDISQSMIDGFMLAWTDNLPGVYTQDTKTLIDQLVKDTGELFSAFTEDGANITPESIDELERITLLIGGLFAHSTNEETAAIGRNFEHLSTVLSETDPTNAEQLLTILGRFNLEDNILDPEAATELAAEIDAIDGEMARLLEIMGGETIENPSQALFDQILNLEGIRTNVETFGDGVVDIFKGRILEGAQKIQEAFGNVILGLFDFANFALFESATESPISVSLSDHLRSMEMEATSGSSNPIINFLQGMFEQVGSSPILQQFLKNNLLTLFSVVFGLMKLSPGLLIISFGSFFLSLFSFGEETIAELRVKLDEVFTTLFSGDIFGALGQAFQFGVSLVQSIIDGILSLFGLGGPQEAIGDAVSGAMEGASGSRGGLGRRFGDGKNNRLDKIVKENVSYGPLNALYDTLILPIIEGIEEAIGKISEFFNNLATDLGNGVITITGYITDILNGIKNFITDDVWSGATGLLGQFLVSILNPITGGGFTKNYEGLPENEQERYQKIGQDMITQILDLIAFGINSPGIAFGETIAMISEQVGTIILSIINIGLQGFLNIVKTGGLLAGSALSGLASDIGESFIDLVLSIIENQVSQIGQENVVQIQSTLEENFASVGALIAAGPLVTAFFRSITLRGGGLSMSLIFSQMFKGVVGVGLGLAIFEALKSGLTYLTSEEGIARIGEMALQLISSLADSVKTIVTGGGGGGQADGPVKTMREAIIELVSAAIAGITMVSFITGKGLTTLLAPVSRIIGVALAPLIASATAFALPIALGLAFVGVAAFIFDGDFRNNLIKGAEDLLKDIFGEANYTAAQEAIARGILGIINAVVAPINVIINGARNALAGLELAALYTVRTLQLINRDFEGADATDQRIAALQKTQEFFANIQSILTETSPENKVTTGLAAFFFGEATGEDVEWVRKVLLDDVLKDAFTPEYVAQSLELNFTDMLNSPTIQAKGGVAGMIATAIEGGADAASVGAAILTNILKLKPEDIAAILPELESTITTAFGERSVVGQALINALSTYDLTKAPTAAPPGQLSPLAAFLQAIWGDVPEASMPEETKSEIQRQFWNEFLDVLAEITGEDFTGEGLTELPNLFDTINNLASIGGFSEEQKTEITDILESELRSIITNAGLSDDPEVQAIATQIVDGLKTGFGNSEESLKASVGAVGTTIINEMKQTLLIKSPSEVMDTIGKNIIEGISNGMLNNMPLLQVAFDAINAMINNLRMLWTTTLLIMSSGFMTFAITLQIWTPIITTEITKITERLGAMLLTIADLNMLLELFVDNLPTGTTIRPSAPGAKPAQFGANVNANQVYKILEGGLPFEVFRSSNGQSFLIPRVNGQIISPMQSQFTQPPGINRNPVSNFSNTDSSITIPVTIGSIQGGISQQDARAIGQNIAEGIQEKLGDRKQTLSDRLTRRGAI